MPEGPRKRKGVEEVTPQKGKKPAASWDNRLKKRPPTCWEQYGAWFWRLLLLEFVIFVLAVIIVLSKESPITPRKLELPPPRPLEGALAPNKVLQKAKKLFEGELIGPESLVMLDGKIYTGSYDGKIVQLEDDKKMTTIAQFGKEPCGTPENEHTCGRPLGIHVSEQETLYVVDSYLGVYEVNVTGEYTQILSNTRHYNGYPIRFGNDITRVPDGDFFFTDSDFKWERRDFPYMIFELSAHGRLVWYNPVTRFSNVALFDLFFPNGLLLSADKQFLLICETTQFRVIKYYLEGPKQGKTEIFIDNLPSLPDNIRPSKNGGYWVSFAGPLRDPKKWFDPVDAVRRRPWIREQIVKVIEPRTLINLIPKYGLIIELNKQGEIIRSLHDPTGEVIASASEVLDTGDALYIGSYNAPFLAKLDYSELPEITKS